MVERQGKERKGKERGRLAYSKRVPWGTAFVFAPPVPCNALFLTPLPNPSPTSLLAPSFPGDTGSTPVQIASMTVRIEALRSHCGQHKKDKHNRRGLDALVTKRRKLMQYLERKDFASYADVVKRLGLKPLK